MAKFKRNNLELKTNQKIFLGNSNQVEIKYDGTDLLIDSSVRMPEHIAVGNQAAVDQYGQKVINVNENFEAGSGGGIGLSVNINSDVDDGGAWTIGTLGFVQTSTVLHNIVQGAYFFANCTGDSVLVSDIIGVQGGASCPADNSTISEMVGGKFLAGTGFSMSNQVITNMMAGKFQVLDVGSGDVSVQNAYGVYILTPGYNPSGTTTNLYGLRIEDQSTVGFTNHFNLFSAGVNSENYFEGNVNIDGELSVLTLTTDSTAGITIVGDLTVTGNLEAGSGDLDNPLYLGQEDSEAGEINLWGDGPGSTTGGLLRMYMAADHDTDMQYYWMRVLEDDLLIGSQFSSAAIKLQATGTSVDVIFNEHVNINDSWESSGDGEVKGGELTVGVNDSAKGTISAYGAATAPSGGEIRVYNPANQDTPDYYHMMAYGPDLFIGSSDDIDSFVWDQSEQNWEFRSGNVSFGHQGFEGGIIYIRGNPTGGSGNQGGWLQIHTADDWDTTIARYDLNVWEDDLWFGPDTDYDAITYDGSEGKWIIDGQTNGVELKHAGITVFETDSTGIVVTGDIYCDDLYASGDTIHVGTGQIKSTAGNIELYDNGIKVLETTTEGFNIFDTNGNDPTINFKDDGGVTLSKIISVGSALVGASSTGEWMWRGFPNGGFFAYHDGDLAFNTEATGIAVSDTNGNDPTINFYTDSVDLQAQIIASDTAMTMNHRVGISWETFLVANKNGSVDLYYDDTKVFETDSTGIIVTGDVTATTYHGDGSQLSGIVHTTPAGNNNEVQYNNNGEFGASQHFTFTGSAIQIGTSGIQISAYGDIGRANNDIYVIGGSTGNPTGQSHLHLQNDGGAILRGSEPAFGDVHGGDVTLHAGDGSGVGIGGDVILDAGLGSTNGSVLVKVGGNTVGDFSFDQVSVIADDSYVKVVDDGTATGYVEIVTDGDQVAYFDAEATSIRLGKASSAGKVVISDTIVELYYSGNKKFETTNTGILIAGDAELTAGDVNLDQSQALQFYISGAYRPCVTVSGNQFTGGFFGIQSIWEGSGHKFNISGGTEVQITNSGLHIEDFNKIILNANAEIEAFDSGGSTLRDVTGRDMTTEHVYLGDVLEDTEIRALSSIVGNISGVDILSIESTGITVIGDIYCDDLFTSGDTIHIGSFAQLSAPGVAFTLSSLDASIEINGASGVERIEATIDGNTNLTVDEFSVELGSGGFKRLETSGNGWVLIYNGSEYSGISQTNGNDLYLKNFHHGGWVEIQGEDNSGNEEVFFRAIPDQAVFLYYNNIATFATQQDGILIDGEGSIKMSGSVFEIKNNLNGQEIQLRGVATVGGNKTMIIAVPDAAVSLAYDGTIVFETIETGIKVDHVEYNSTPADLEGSGDILTETVDSTSGVATLVTMDSSGDWVDANASDESTVGILAILLEGSAGSKKIMMKGVMRDDSWNWSASNKQLYIDTTDGQITETRPSGAGEFIQVVGYSMTADKIYFNPSSDYAEVV